MRTQGERGGVEAVLGGKSILLGSRDQRVAKRMTAPPLQQAAHMRFSLALAGIK